MRLLVLALIATSVVGCARSERTPAAVPRPTVATFQSARSDRDQILDALVRDVLVSDFLNDIRADYGTPGNKQVALVLNGDYGVPWPDDYQPLLPAGYEVRRVVEGTGVREDQPRLLGIRIDKLDLDQKATELYREPIRITLLNAGGTKNGNIAGGCSVYYIPVRKEGGWEVKSMRLEGQ